MRKIVRWTIGNNNPKSIACLKLSIKLWENIFGNQFEIMVCYNGEKPNLKHLLIDQQDYIDSLPIPPYTTAWKLYPPRLDINSHEIFVDNDLLIYNNHRYIEEFMDRDDMFFISEAWERSYGNFDTLVPDNFIVNTGFFGLPPGYDFANDLSSKCLNWGTHFDEQGVVASILASKNIKVIPTEDIKVCVSQEPFSWGKCGMHFVGLNDNYTEHWDNFIYSIIM